MSYNLNVGDLFTHETDFKNGHIGFTLQHSDDHAFNPACYINVKGMLAIQDNVSFSLDYL